ncbi:MAG: hypothetical protein MN733_06655, partial [Nitrososphaera sp.]|nr:hypothetical protein [Nitrososphaera sp.]
VDPILPLISDSEEDMDLVVGNCKDAGLSHVFGAIIRLRADIWERMKVVLRLLGVEDGIEIYKNIFRFEEPLGPSYLAANGAYSQRILRILKHKVTSSGMICGFPDMSPKKIDKSHLGQQTLAGYLNSPR